MYFLVVDLSFTSFIHELQSISIRIQSPHFLSTAVGGGGGELNIAASVSSCPVVTPAPPYLRHRSRSFRLETKWICFLAPTQRCFQAGAQDDVQNIVRGHFLDFVFLMWETDRQYVGDIQTRGGAKTCVSVIITAMKGSAWRSHWHVQVSNMCTLKSTCLRNLKMSCKIISDI